MADNPLHLQFREGLLGSCGWPRYDARDLYLLYEPPDWDMVMRHVEQYFLHWSHIVLTFAGPDARLTALDGYAPMEWWEIVDDEPETPSARGALHLEGIKDPDVRDHMGEVLRYTSPPDRSWVRLVLRERLSARPLQVAQNVLVSLDEGRLTDIWLLDLKVVNEKRGKSGAHPSAT